MLKTLEPGGKAKVELTLDPRVGASSAAVCGDWNEWSAELHPMIPTADGGFSLTLHLTVGRRYRFRYLLDGVRWENDWDADAYVPNDFGQDDSVIDLTAVEGSEGATNGAVPAKKRASSRSATGTRAKATATATEPGTKVPKRAAAAEGETPVKKKGAKKAAGSTPKAAKKSSKE